MKFIVLDFETTGLSAKENRIIEIGYALIEDGKIIDVYSQLVDPGVEITNPKITEITGIRNDMLQGMPKLEDEMKKLHKLIEGKLIVAHNAAFDMGFLNNTFYKMGLATYHSSLCTSKLFKHYKTSLHIHYDGASLAAMTQFFDVNHTSAHRAGSDAEVTAKCFLEMCKEIDYRDHMEGASKRSKKINQLDAPSKTDIYMRSFDEHRDMEAICDQMKVKVSTVSKYFLAWLQYADPQPYSDFIKKYLPDQRTINEILRLKATGKRTAGIHRELGGGVEYFVIQIVARLGNRGITKLSNS
jgi:DNA polymerase III epsilon subunit family exonuclease